MMYGSPVASRVSTSFWNSARASTVPRADPSLGERSTHSAPSRTASMKASGMSTPWWRFNALRLKSPLGFRISRNSSISGCEMSR